MLGTSSLPVLLTQNGPRGADSYPAMHSVRLSKLYFPQLSCGNAPIILRKTWGNQQLKLRLVSRHDTPIGQIVKATQWSLPMKSMRVGQGQLTPRSAAKNFIANHFRASPFGRWVVSIHATSRISTSITTLLLSEWTNTHSAWHVLTIKHFTPMLGSSLVARSARLSVYENMQEREGESNREKERGRETRGGGADPGSQTTKKNKPAATHHGHCGVGLEEPQKKRKKTAGHPEEQEERRGEERKGYGARTGKTPKTRGHLSITTAPKPKHNITENPTIKTRQHSVKARSPKPSWPEHFRKVKLKKGRLRKRELCDMGLGPKTITFCTQTNQTQSFPLGSHQTPSTKREAKTKMSGTLPRRGADSRKKTLQKPHWAW